MPVWGSPITVLRGYRHSWRPVRRQSTWMHCALLLTDQNELLITRGMQARIQLQRQPVSLGPPLAGAEDCAG